MRGRLMAWPAMIAVPSCRPHALITSVPVLPYGGLLTVVADVMILIVSSTASTNVFWADEAPGNILQHCEQPQPH